MPAAIYMLLIFLLSGRSDLQGVPALVSDKAAHFAAYMVLGVLLVRAIGGRGWKRPGLPVVLAAAAIAAAYGATDELHQRFVPGRSSEALDLLADAAGGLSGAGAVYAWGIITKLFRPDPV